MDSKFRRSPVLQPPCEWTRIYVSLSAFVFLLSEVLNLFNLLLKLNI